MDYKALLEKVYDLLKSFLALIGLDDKIDLDKITGEVEDILGAE